MTRFHTPELADVITGGSWSRELVADVFYGQTRRYQDLPCDTWSFTGDYDAQIKTSAKVTVAYQGDFADSLSPEDVTDILAPFGQELRLSMIVRAGAFEERIAMGTYLIDEVPSTRDVDLVVGGRRLTVGSIIELALLDRFKSVELAKFRSLEQPVSLTSAWGELARISRLQVTRTVPDVEIPRSIVYARSRLDTIQQLARLLGGRAIMLADGTVGVVPDTITEADVRLFIGEDRGTIIGAGNYLSADGVANVVVGDFEDVDGNPIHVEDWIRTGPLATDTPFGERVVEYPGDQKEFIRTEAAARTAVANHLARVSQVGPREIPVEIVPDPRIEIGDVVELERPDRTITGRVVKYSLDKTGPQRLTVRT